MTIVSLLITLSYLFIKYILPILLVIFIVRTINNKKRCEEETLKTQQQILKELQNRNGKAE